MKHTVRDNITSVVLGILCLAWVYPVFMILFNSLKKETACRFYYGLFNLPVTCR